MRRMRPLLLLVALGFWACTDSGITDPSLQPELRPQAGILGGSSPPGKIVVNHDEWTMGDPGFFAADGEAFALSLASWFAGGGTGSFLVYSNDQFIDPAQNGPLLEATMLAAGHGWVISPAVPVTLAELLAYDAVFLAGPFPTPLNAPPSQLLIDYVEAGGNIYLAGGTGDFAGSPAVEAAEWNPFLNHFNLAFGPTYGVEGVFAVMSSHPIFNGVTDLYYVNGNPVSEVDPADPRTEILETVGSHGLIAVFDAVLTALIDIKPGSDPNCVNNDGHGVIPVAILGTADFDVTLVDPSTVQLEGMAVAARGKASKLLSHLEDVNGDGYMDLVMQIEDTDGSFAVGTSSATLTGQLYGGGLWFEGTDQICIVP